MNFDLTFKKEMVCKDLSTGVCVVGNFSCIGNGCLFFDTTFMFLKFKGSKTV